MLKDIRVMGAICIIMAITIFFLLLNTGNLKQSNGYLRGKLIQYEEVRELSNFIGVKQASIMFNIKKEALYNLARGKNVTSYKIGGRIIIDKSSLEQYLK